MTEEATWGIGVIVKWILIIAVIIITVIILYNFLVKPVMDTFGKEATLPLFMLIKNFKKSPAIDFI
ncbi:MAG: hypothetical protein KJ767_03580 [Nanoarchaeota archaeon]|nr:hypothetical protein [Nanoarchaeota archaeon]